MSIKIEPIPCVLTLPHRVASEGRLVCRLMVHNMMSFVNLRVVHTTLLRRSIQRKVVQRDVAEKEGALVSEAIPDSTDCTENSRKPSLTEGGDVILALLRAVCMSRFFSHGTWERLCSVVPILAVLQPNKYVTFREVNIQEHKMCKIKKGVRYHAWIWSGFTKNSREIITAKTRETGLPAWNKSNVKM